MVSQLQVLGVYPVPAATTVHLIELLLRECQAPFDFFQITQPLLGIPRDHWQAAYDERILNLQGTSIIADPWIDKLAPEFWSGDVRVAFFFHELNPSLPLKTSWGFVTLPEPTPLPDRLKIMPYESPD